MSNWVNLCILLANVSMVSAMLLQARTRSRYEAERGGPPSRRWPFDRTKETAPPTSSGVYALMTLAASLLIVGGVGLVVT